MKNMAHVVNNIVVNISVWDGESDWTPKEEVVEIPEGEFVAIGWSYADDKFANPNQEEND